MTGHEEQRLPSGSPDASRSSSPGHQVPATPGPPPEPERCPNCDAPLAGAFCSACGQKRGSTHVSLGHLLHELIEDHFHLDGKLLRTLLYLFRPGFLTNEFLKGRRVRYVGPFKLYLTTTLVFFFVWMVFPSPRSAARSDAEQGAAKVRAKLQEASDALREAREEGVPISAELEQALAKAAPAPPMDATEEAQRDSINVDLKINPEDSSPLLREFEQRARRFSSAKPGDRIHQAFGNHVPKALFLLLPLFALMLKVLYRRSGRFYAEHFVFALHFHSFFFVARLLHLPAQYLPWLAGIISLVPMLYLVLALRSVYGGTILKTLVKVGLLLTSYLVLVGLSLAAIILWTIWARPGA